MLTVRFFCFGLSVFANLCFGTSFRRSFASRLVLFLHENLFNTRAQFVHRLATTDSVAVVCFVNQTKEHLYQRSYVVGIK